MVEGRPTVPAAHVAKRIGCAVETVRAALELAGIAPLSRAEASGKHDSPRGTRPDPVLHLRILEHCKILGGNTPTVPARQVARELRCCIKTVRAALRRAGIEPLSPAEARRLRV